MSNRKVQMNLSQFCELLRMADENRGRKFAIELVVEAAPAITANLLAGNWVEKGPSDAE